jgi:transcriptional regulator with XRE-family HTH domain
MGLSHFSQMPDDEAGRSELREIRMARGLTLESVAYLAGCDKATVSRIERGLQAPRPEMVVRISRALGVSINRIVVAKPRP